MVRYFVVGGMPFQVYNGTTTFTGLYSLGIFNTQEEAENCRNEKYNECGGLISWFEVPFEEKQ